MNKTNHHNSDCKQIINEIKLCGKELGLEIGIIKPQVDQSAINKFITWLENGNHGTMQFMLKHKNLRIDPRELMPEVKSIICCRFDYAVEDSADTFDTAATLAQIAPYARCRDYHKIMRHRLRQLAQRIEIFINKNQKNTNFQYRVFCDSAPVMEKALAVQAGLGWIGKNTLLINKDAGAYSFLGEIYTNLDLNLEIDVDLDLDSPPPPLSTPSLSTPSPSTSTPIPGCGACTKCIDACPTKALHSPYSLDTRRCIAYLTIEHDGKIAPELQQLIGARIFGCNECQRCCPWNAKKNSEKENVRKESMEGIESMGKENINKGNEDNSRNIVGKKNGERPENLTPLTSWSDINLNLLELYSWDEATYLCNTAGTPLRRLGYTKWQRNLEIALENTWNEEAVKRNNH